MSRINVRYFFGEGLANVFVHGFMSFAAITVIAACLLITATFSLVAYNIDLLVRELESRSEIAVFIDERMTRQQALDLGGRLEALENIESVVFVSKEEAFESYLDTLGDYAYILEDLRENNPMRDGYRLVMRDVELHAQTVKEIEQVSGVASTRSDQNISDTLIQIRRAVNAVSYVLVGLLGTVSVFIMSNTIRLAMFSRREEIGIMKMVGATNGFIRAPFVVEGMILGLFASTLAFFALWGVYGYMARGLIGGTAIFKVVPFTDFAGSLAMILAGAGLVVGIGGSVLTIRRFMKV